MPLGVESFLPIQDKKDRLGLTYGRFLPLIECRGEVDPQSPRVVAGIELLKGVPDQIHKIIAKNGGHIIFFNGRITDQPEFEHDKGRRPRGYPEGIVWDNLLAGHDRTTHTAMISINGSYTNMLINVLHEYGHCFDDTLGKEFFSILGLFPRSLSKTRELTHLVNYYRYLLPVYEQHPREFVACAFEQWYISDSSRFSFQEALPLMANLLTRIELMSWKWEAQKRYSHSVLPPAYW